MLFILCDNEKALFFMQSYHYVEIWWKRMLLRSLKQVVWTKSAIYIHYLHNVADVKGPQQSFYFLNSLLTFFYSFSLWMFQIFLYECFFKNSKLKNSLDACFPVKSYTQVFMNFNKLFQISENIIVM